MNAEISESIRARKLGSYASLYQQGAAHTHNLNEFFLLSIPLYMPKII